ncbi:MAG: tetratricopeptide repeat protein [Bacteroidetes bacterium]|nr:tetratricopeptide repeat protein [Bacteroidota bacterium]
MKFSREGFLLLLFVAGIYIRKTGIPGGILFLVLSGMLLSTILISGGINDMYKNYRQEGQIKLSPELIFGISFFLLLLRLQYWGFGENTGWFIIALIGSYLLFLILKQFSSNGFSWLMKSRMDKVSYSAAILILLLISYLGVVWNAREFHNTFRASRYEEYIRTTFPDSLQSNADAIIEKNKCKSPECIAKAEEKFKQAMFCDSLKDYQQALKWLNYAVDLNPDNPEYYFQRGHLKLIKLDISEEAARSALIDFNRAIQLKPEFAHAYYFRGITLAYLDKKDKVCPDMIYAKQLDSALIIRDYLNKFCPDSGSFSTEQIHP